MSEVSVLSLESIFSSNQHPIFTQPIASQDFTARVACYSKIFSRLDNFSRFEGLKFVSNRSSGSLESLIRGMISIFYPIEIKMSHYDDMSKEWRHTVGNFCNQTVFKMIPFFLIFRFFSNTILFANTFFRNFGGVFGDKSDKLMCSASSWYSKLYVGQKFLKSIF